MKYDPDQHHRKSIRLKGYNYCQAGQYFITICTYQKQCLFGEIINGKTQLNEYGKIAEYCWQTIPEHFPKIQLDLFVIMPNHIHGILVITDNGRDMAMPCPYRGEFGKPITGSLPTIIRSFKSAVTKQINIFQNTPGNKIWQKNYYEHIIRNENSLAKIRQYIQTNPLVWKSDRLHPNNSAKW
ncbi:MAG: transposase [Stanieria sp.]